MTWSLRQTSRQKGRNVWIRSLAMLACAALLGSQTASADDAASGPLEEEALGAVLEAERAARGALEAEVDQLRATVDRLEADREATAREMRSLRALVEAIGAQNGSTSLVSAGGSAPPNGSAAQGSTNGSAVRPVSTLPRVFAAATDEAESEAPEDTAAPEAESEDAAGPEAGSEDAAGPEAPKPEKVGKSWEREARYQAERDMLEQRGGVLLPAGQLVLQPGLSYTNFERNRLRLSGFALLPAILIGRIDSVEIDRDIYQTTLVARYGLHDRIEMSASIPYLWRVESEIFGAEGDEDRDVIRGDGIGDLEVGLFAHVFRERGWIPDIILNLRGRAPTGDDPFEVDVDEVATGSGFWGLSGGVTLTKVVDPVVLFVSGRYGWNIDRHINDIGRVDPGDTVEYNLGLAFGLNERLALSLSVQQRLIGRTKLDGEKVDLSDVNAAAFFVGSSYVLNRWLSPSVSVGFGLTEDAPDYQLQLSFPIRLPYRLPSLPFSF